MYTKSKASVFLKQNMHFKNFLSLFLTMFLAESESRVMLLFKIV